MKLPKKIAALLTVTLVTSSAGNLGYADTTKEVSEDKLVGAGRWETAIEVSKKGWEKSDTAIIVNDSTIADALAATPFAEANDAPILLTGKDKLDERTNAELKRLGVKKVYLIGGEAVLSTNIETELKAQNIEIDRIQGQTRELTALEIAKRLDKIKDISEIAVVNGTTGLADAVSIAAVAAEKDMAIILSNPIDGTKASDEFIKNEDIKISYVIGGPNSVSKEVASKLPNAKRIEGIDRNETNAKVIETFYNEKELNNAYVAKDGMGKEDQLIDALAVGVLAAKNESPVIIVGNKLNQMQKDVTNTKSFKAITQVGGNGNEDSFGELKSMQGVTIYEVSTVKELNDALDKADANDVINVRSLDDNPINSKIEIKSNKAIKINLYATSGKSVVLEAKSGTLIAHQTHTSIDIKSGELIINGKVSTVNVLEGGEATISNDGTSKPNVTVAQGASVEVAGKINTITVNGKDAAVSVGKDSIVSKVEVSLGASGTVIDNAGKVDSVVSNAPNVSVDNSGTVGTVGGSNTPTINGNPVKPPSTGGGSSSGGNTQNPTISVSGVSVINDGDNITVTATSKNYGSKSAKVELIQETTVVISADSVEIVNGTISHTFEGVENGTYTAKVTVGSVSASSESFILDVWDGTRDSSVTPNEEGIYEINTESQLAGVADLVNSGKTDISIRLMNDMDLNNIEWTPIGTETYKFVGTFDGNNKTIKNLSITKGNEDNIGLFGFGTYDIELKNINIENINITGKQNVGSLIGYIFGTGTISNCNVKNAEITATLKDVGGIIGAGYVNISDCNLENLTVIAEKSIFDGDNVGSAIGYLADGKHTVSNVKAKDVTLSGERKVGGIAGSANHSAIIFENCKVTGNTSINVRGSLIPYPFAGGIVGESVQKGITVKDCFVDKATVTISGKNNNLLGWLVGGSRENKGESLKEGDINFVGINSFDENQIQ